GLPVEPLRLVLPGRPPAAAMAALLEALVQRGSIAWDGPWLRLPGHSVTLSAEDKARWSQARGLIAASPWRPPRTRDLARALAVPEPEMRATLKRLQRAGWLIEVAPDHFFPNRTVAAMAALAVELAAAPTGLTAAAFRDRLGNGRKVAIQVLEFFDRVGLTARVGESRRVRPDRLALFGGESPGGARTMLLQKWRGT
ncbi:MAG TPA: SelB C-terminal domain-containing protein, partial [Acetobacteraceae bacterium]|nr:SelB C-terminal domain-containing protein [Acetobacteraceae bacterium]